MPVGKNIQEASRLLKQGALVAIPTETVYGLAGNAFSADAVAKIYRAKNRPQFNPLIIHSNSLQRFESWGLQVPEKMRLLAEHFSPGPLTYVIPKNDRIPDLVTAGTAAVAIRIPDHPLTLELLAGLDFPVAAPSANPSGFISPTAAEHVNEQLGQQVAYILDGGSCRVGVESTIISFLNDVPEILRHGGTAIESIRKVIGEVIDLEPGKITTDNPVAPGMLARHYAPRHPLIFGEVEKHLSQKPAVRTAIISFSKRYEGVPLANQFVLSHDKNMDEAAQKLFAAMRDADKLDVDVILAEKFPDEGLGRAINDRLGRAAVAE